MTEEDIKLQYITPAITVKWSQAKITMETKVTDGRVNLKGNIAVREKPKKADYILYLNANNPIAIVEAKDNNHTVSHGLQHAMTYAQMLDIPFAFSSNGDGIADWDYNIERLKKARNLDILNFELSIRSKPNRHENDIYGKMTLEQYFSEAYKRACRIAYRYRV